MDIQGIKEYFELYIQAKEYGQLIPPRTDVVRKMIKALEELQKYKELGTLEEIQEAVNKSNKIKPYMESDGYANEYPVWNYYCPVCNKSFEEYEYTEYCPACGQHIDWEGL